jgi:hypothetical protein
MMPEKPESIYEPYRPIREVREGQTAGQCERASDETPALIPESVEGSIRMAQSARAAEQDRLEKLKQESKGLFQVLQDDSTNEQAKEAAFLRYDAIRQDIGSVQGKIAALTEMLEELEQERLVIPEDAYRKGPKPGTSEKTGPFDFQRQRRK